MSEELSEKSLAAAIKMLEEMTEDRGERLKHSHPTYWAFSNGSKVWWLNPEPDEVGWEGSPSLECADGGGQADSEDEDTS